MDLVERYIYAVVKHLPKKSRIEVTNELRANIEDMLPPSASTAAIKAVLTSLGKPEELAKAYHSDHQYLIGPTYYHSFLATVKLVVIITMSVVAVGKIIAVTLSAESTPTLSFVFGHFFDIYGTTVLSGFLSAAIVAVVFIIIEKVVYYEAKHGKAIPTTWDPGTLPAIPQQQIPKYEPIVSIVFTLIFSFLIFFTPNFRFFYTTAEPIPALFNADRYNQYLPFMMLYIALYLAMNIMKLIKGTWNQQIAIVNTIQNLYFCILATMMLLDQSLVEADFMQYLADLLDISLRSVKDGFASARIITILVIFIIAIIDTVMGFVKAKRTVRENHFTAEITSKR